MPTEPIVKIFELIYTDVWVALILTFSFSKYGNVAVEMTPCFKSKVSSISHPITVALDTTHSNWRRESAGLIYCLYLNSQTFYHVLVVRQQFITP